MIKFVFGSSYSAMPAMKGRCCTEAGEGGASLVDAFGGMLEIVGKKGGNLKVRAK